MTDTTKTLIEAIGEHHKTMLLAMVQLLVMERSDEQSELYVEICESMRLLTMAAREVKESQAAA